MCVRVSVGVGDRVRVTDGVCVRVNDGVLVTVGVNHCLFKSDPRCHSFLFRFKYLANSKSLTGIRLRLGRVWKPDSMGS